MGVSFAYGPREEVNRAIQLGIIPKNSIIITKNDRHSAELMFYDDEVNLKHIVAKTKFDSVEEAVSYAAANSIFGGIITVLNNGKYETKVVQGDHTLSDVETGAIREETIQEIVNTTIKQIPIATDKTPGIVLSTPEKNGVLVTANGKMYVDSLDVKKITQGVGDEVILDCGTSGSSK